MSLWTQFLWVITPYVCLTIFFGGHVYRFIVDRGSWGSRSSELLEKRQLMWANPFFHYGTLAAIGGHVAGLLIPIQVYEAFGIPAELYHLVAIVLGGAAGLAMLIGLLGLIWRRLSAPRLKAVTRPADWVVLILLAVLTVLGVAVTLGYDIFVSSYEYRASVGPYFRGLFTFHVDPALMRGAPFLFQLHVWLAFPLYAVWPFTRLVHVWTAPIQYLWRPFIPFRRHEYAPAPRPAPERTKE